MLLLGNFYRLVVSNTLTSFRLAKWMREMSVFKTSMIHLVARSTMVRDDIKKGL